MDSRQTRSRSHPKRSDRLGIQERGQSHSPTFPHSGLYGRQPDFGASPVLPAGNTLASGSRENEQGALVQGQAARSGSPVLTANHGAVTSSPKATTAAIEDEYVHNYLLEAEQQRTASRQPLSAVEEARIMGAVTREILKDGMAMYQLASDVANNSRDDPERSFRMYATSLPSPNPSISNNVSIIVEPLEYRSGSYDLDLGEPEENYTVEDSIEIPRGNSSENTEEEGIQEDDLPARPQRECDRLLLSANEIEDRLTLEVDPQPPAQRLQEHDQSYSLTSPQGGLYGRQPDLADLGASPILPARRTLASGSRENERAVAQGQAARSGSSVLTANDGVASPTPTATACRPVAAIEDEYVHDRMLEAEQQHTSRIEQPPHNIPQMDSSTSKSDSELHLQSDDSVNADNVNADIVNADNVNADNVNADIVNADNVNADNVNADNVNADPPISLRPGSRLGKSHRGRANPLRRPAEQAVIPRPRGPDLVQVSHWSQNTDGTWRKSPRGTHSQEVSSGILNEIRNDRSYHPVMTAHRNDFTDYYTPPGRPSIVMDILGPEAIAFVQFFDNCRAIYDEAQATAKRNGDSCDFYWAEGLKGTYKPTKEELKGKLKQLGTEYSRIAAIKNQLLEQRNMQEVAILKRDLKHIRAKEVMCRFYKHNMDVQEPFCVDLHELTKDDVPSFVMLSLLQFQIDYLKNPNPKLEPRPPGWEPYIIFIVGTARLRDTAPVLGLAVEEYLLRHCHKVLAYDVLGRVKGSLFPTRYVTTTNRRQLDDQFGPEWYRQRRLDSPPRS